MLSKSQVKYIQSLGHKKFRNEAGLFLAEGPRIVEELLAGARPMVQQVYGLGAWIAAHQALLGEVPCLEISAGELDR
ncbi:MAG TPA: hypothetical protein VG870_00935, partial [Chitinophagaceae bacterium]|nr:hypothetical protein [Chitinophagaceae bacterium]